MARVRKATKAGSRKRTKKPAKEASQEKVLARIVMDASDDVPVYYSNFAEITHTQHEFGLHFAQSPNKLTKAHVESAKETGLVHIDPIFSVGGLSPRHPVLTR